MSHQKETAQHSSHQKQNMSMGQYVKLRNGVPLGHAKSLPNMLYRSFGAPSFAVFWQYWNPIWGYALGKYVCEPLSRFLPRAVAFILTFVVSGAIHDVAATAVSRSFVFVLTPWFFFLGLGAILSRLWGMDLSKRAWGVRAGANLAYLLISFGFARGVVAMGEGIL